MSTESIGYSKGADQMVARYKTAREGRARKTGQWWAACAAAAIVAGLLVVTPGAAVAQPAVAGQDQVAAAAATADSPQFTTALIGKVQLTAEGVNAFHITPVTAGATAPTPTTTSTLPVSVFAAGDANIINSRSSIAGGSFNACKDFNATTCILANGIGTLEPGQSTEGRYGWADSDGFYCMTHRRFQVMSSHVTCSTNKWIKVSGGAIGQIDVSIIVRNR